MILQGYLDPEYFLTHKLTDKSDVYSLGVVFLELLTGMQPIMHGKNLVREVKASPFSCACANLHTWYFSLLPTDKLFHLFRLTLHSNQALFSRS